MANAFIPVKGNDEFDGEDEDIDMGGKKLSVSILRNVSLKQAKMAPQNIYWIYKAANNQQATIAYAYGNNI